MESEKQVYRAEAHKLLAELETSLLKLEEASDDSELIDGIDHRRSKTGAWPEYPGKPRSSRKKVVSY